MASSLIRSGVSFSEDRCFSHPDGRLEHLFHWVALPSDGVFVKPRVLQRVRRARQTQSKPKLLFFFFTALSFCSRPS